MPGSTRPFWLIQWILFGPFFLSSPSHALLDGELVSEQQSSTMLIVTTKTVWSHLYGKSVEQEHFCSATILGVKPLTLITASHCLRDVDMGVDHKTPVVHIRSSEYPQLNTLKLSKAIYTDYAMLEDHLDMDIAVLVFDGKIALNMEITSIPIVLDARPRYGVLCGFGGSLHHGNGAASCAVKPLISNPKNFYEILPQDYENMDRDFFTLFKTQFDSKNTMVSSVDALLAVNRLDFQGRYSTNVPMPTVGDSGGPWLIRNRQNKYGLIGITSFIESFYRRNIDWPFFADKSIPIEEFSYVAYGIRLDASRPSVIIREALAQGADISFVKAQVFFGD